MPSETTRTYLVAVSVALVCSILVSAAAVTLRPIQNRNRALERMRNVLVSAELDGRDMGITETFNEYVTPILVDIQDGTFETGVDVNAYYRDLNRTLGDPAKSITLSAENDIADINRIPKKALAYLVRQDEKIRTVVLPVKGKGLWSTIYGFLALEPDTVTVKGITFYEHGETPGLGGEIDNPRWKAQWEDKQVLDDNFDPAIRLVKGNVGPDTPDAKHKVDALSGATLTTRGVENLVRFWVGENGFGPFLENIRKSPGGA